MNRASHSFFAAFIGWLLPFIGYLAWMQFNEDGFGYITDFNFLLFWPLLFTALGWLTVGLPLSVTLWRETTPGFGKTILISTAATTGTFLAIAALFRLGLMYFVWWPVLIGLIGGSIYWLLQQWQPLRGWMFWVIPILFFPFVRFLALPIGIAFFPYTTHVLADGAIGQDAHIEIIRRVEVGDTYEELHKKYPEIFDDPFSSTSFSGGGWSYSIRLDNVGGRVVEVEIAPQEFNPDPIP